MYCIIWLPNCPQRPKPVMQTTPLPPPPLGSSASPPAFFCEVEEDIATSILRGERGEGSMPGAHGDGVNAVLRLEASSHGNRNMHGIEKYIQKQQQQYMHAAAAAA